MEGAGLGIHGDHSGTNATLSERSELVSTSTLSFADIRGRSEMVNDSTKTKELRVERKQAEYRPVLLPASATDCLRGFGQGPSQHYLSNKGEGATGGGEQEGRGRH